MKKWIFILTLNLFLTSSRGQGTYSKVYYDSLDDRITFSMAQSFDNGIILAGSYGLMKLDSTGLVLWCKKYSPGAGGSVAFTRVVRCADSSFFAMGTSIDTAGNRNVYCLKIDSGGNPVWASKFGTTTQEELMAGQQTSDGGYIVVANTDVFSAHPQMLVLKLDSSGHFQWNESLTRSGISYMVSAVKQGPDGGYILTGLTNYGTGTGAVLVKLDTAGTLAWSKTYYQTSQAAQGFDLVPVPGGIVLFMQKRFSPALMKVDTIGNVLWVNDYMSLQVYQGWSVPPKMVVTQNGGYAFVNGTGDVGYFGLYHITVTDSNGQNARSEETILNPLDLFENQDGGFTVCGNGPLYNLRPSGVVYPPHSGVIRMDSTGINSCTFGPLWSSLVQADSIHVVSQLPAVVNSGILIPDTPLVSMVTMYTDSGCVGLAIGLQEMGDASQFSLYPNPSSGDVHFQCNVPAGDIQLSVVNILGQEVYSKQLTAEETRSITLPMSGMPGVYTVVVRSSHGVRSQRLIIQ